MKIVPVTQKTAKIFVAKHHRHNEPSLGSVFQVGLEQDGEIVGVAVAGIPKSRMLMDGRTLEVTRVCVIEGHRNANSMLYGACSRAAAALGYTRLVTYTLPEEGGASLRASGWVADEELRVHDINGWARKHGKGDADLFGNVRLPPGPKVRWFKKL